MKTTVIEKAISLKIATSTIGSESVNTIDARELHRTLKIWKDFSTWIKDRLEKYDFQQGIDFSPKLGKTSKIGWRPQTNYILTLDTAKEIAMVENNEEWRKIRRYLIEVEKKYKNDIRPSLDRSNPVKCLNEAIMLAVHAGKLYNEKMKDFENIQELLASQTHELKELKAENNKYKALTTSVASLGQAEVLMSIEEAGIKVGESRNKIFRELRYRGILNKDNSPRKGYELYFIQKRVKYMRGSHSTTYKQTFALPKGVIFLREIFS